MGKAQLFCLLSLLGGFVLPSAVLAQSGSENQAFIPKDDVIVRSPGGGMKFAKSGSTTAARGAALASGTGKLAAGYDMLLGPGTYSHTSSISVIAGGQVSGSGSTVTIVTNDITVGNGAVLRNLKLTGDVTLGEGVVFDNVDYGEATVDGIPVSPYDVPSLNQDTRFVGQVTLHQFPIIDSASGTGVMLLSPGGHVAAANGVTGFPLIAKGVSTPIFEPLDLAGIGVTGILPANQGGTGTHWFEVAGLSATKKTFTFPNQNATVLTNANLVTVAQGGIGLGNIGAGEILYGFSANVYTALAANTTVTNKFLRSTGTGTFGQAPVWTQITFGHISGNIDPTQMNSGTGATSKTVWRGDGSWAIQVNAGDGDVSIDFDDRKGFGPGNQATLDWGNQLLYASGGSSVALNWELRQAINSSADTVIDWATDLQFPQLADGYLRVDSGVVSTDAGPGGGGGGSDVSYIGTWDASSNTLRDTSNVVVMGGLPDPDSGNADQWVQVTGAGTQTIDGQSLTVYVGDAVLSTGASWFIQPGNALRPSNNLSDLLSVPTARGNLGLGTAATQATGTSGATLPFLNGTNTWANPQSFTSAPVPTTNDGAALGSSSLKWSDLFLATGGVINWNSGNYTLTHSSGTLTASGTLAANLFITSTNFTAGNAGFANAGINADNTTFPIENIGGSVSLLDDSGGQVLVGGGTVTIGGMVAIPDGARIAKREDHTTDVTGTLTLDTDTLDGYELTAQAHDLTIAFTGTPTRFQQFLLVIKGTGSHTISYDTGPSTSADGNNVTRPTAIDTSERAYLWIWSVADSQWRIRASD